MRRVARIPRNSRALLKATAGIEWSSFRRKGPIAYLLKNAAGKVIYAGRGNEYRLQEHRYTKPWWPEVAKVLIRRCADYGESLVIESMFIRKYQPKYNREGVTR